MKRVFGGRTGQLRQRRRQSDYINPPRAHVDKGFDAFMKSAAWKAFRAQVAAERGEVCEDREHDPNKSRTANVELDHIVELADGGEPLSRSNVMFRCHACHVRKTKRLQEHRHEMDYWRNR